MVSHHLIKAGGLSSNKAGPPGLASSEAITPLLMAALRNIYCLFALHQTLQMNTPTLSRLRIHLPEHFSPGPALSKDHWLPLPRPPIIWTLNYQPSKSPPFTFLGGSQAYFSSSVLGCWGGQSGFQFHF